MKKDRVIAKFRVVSENNVAFALLVALYVPLASFSSKALRGHIFESVLLTLVVWALICFALFTLTSDVTVSEEGVEVSGKNRFFVPWSEMSQYSYVPDEQWAFRFRLGTRELPAGTRLGDMHRFVKRFRPDLYEALPAPKDVSVDLKANSRDRLLTVLMIGVTVAIGQGMREGITWLLLPAFAVATAATYALSLWLFRSSLILTKERVTVMAAFKKSVVSWDDILRLEDYPYKIVVVRKDQSPLEIRKQHIFRFEDSRKIP